MKMYSNLTNLLCDFLFTHGYALIYISSVLLPLPFSKASLFVWNFDSNGSYKFGQGKNIY
jgi:hypothetical protein